MWVPASLWGVCGAGTHSLGGGGTRMWRVPVTPLRVAGGNKGPGGGGGTKGLLGGLWGCCEVVTLGGAGGCCGAGDLSHCGAGGAHGDPPSPVRGSLVLTRRGAAPHLPVTPLPNPPIRGCSPLWGLLGCSSRDGGVGPPLLGGGLRRRLGAMGQADRCGLWGSRLRDWVWTMGLRAIGLLWSRAQGWGRPSAVGMGYGAGLWAGLRAHRQGRGAVGPGCETRRAVGQGYRMG